MYGSVLNNELGKKIPEFVVPAATEAGLPQSSLEALFAAITAGDFSSVPGISEEIIGAVVGAVKEAYTESFRMVFYATIPFSVILLLSSILVPNMEKYLTQNVAKKLNDGRGGSAAEKAQVEKIERV